MKNNGNFILKNGDEFEGELKNWKLNGTIKYKFKNGDKFKGKYTTGILEGDFIFQEKFKNIKIEKSQKENKGKVMFKDKSLYEGTLHPEKLTPHGQGKITFSSSNSSLTSFEGEFSFGTMKKGKLIFRNLDFYTGDFNEEGFFHGNGALNLAKEGVKIEGKFKEGYINKGNISFKNGDEYTGDIKQLKAHGVGKYIFCDGDIYKGNFYNGKKSGKGVIMKEEGAWIYEGDFENDVPNGKGVIETEDYILKGFFFDGELEGECDILEKNSNKYL